jgi:hypothetical protein
MSELNFKPAAGGGTAGDSSVPVPALDGGAADRAGERGGRQGRQQRRRLHVLRFKADPGFRLFRVH